jgi:hypothetical protein
MHRMTGYVLAGLVLSGGVVTTVLGELVNEEIRGWLDYLPRAILRLAARRLDPAGKIAIYEDEWLPELTYILRGAEARPISRLVIGTKFSVGLLIAAKRIARHLHGTPSDHTQPGLTPPVMASTVEIALATYAKSLTAEAEEISVKRAALIERRNLLNAAQNKAVRLAAEVGKFRGDLQTVKAALRDLESQRAPLVELDRQLMAADEELYAVHIVSEYCRQRLAGG